jgi:DNA-binding Lrp family transcriptional regulator
LLLRTELVRVFDEYAFSSKRIREVSKQLDPTNIKVLSTMAKVGPRNLLEVSRLTGIPVTTVHHRIAQLDSNSNPLVELIPNVAVLGMARLVVLVAAKPGLEDAVTQALRIPNYWRVLQRCEGTFTHHSVQVVPLKFLKEFREYISTMRAMNLIKSYRIIQTGDSYPIFPDFSSYEFSSGTWTFDWEGWLNAVKNGVPIEVLRDPRGETVSVEKVDLRVIASLERNARMSFIDIAKKIGVSPQTVKYHYDKKVGSSGVLGKFDFLVTPFPLEISAWHEFMLEFQDADSMNRFFSVAKKLFFIYHLAKVHRKNTLLVRTRIPHSQVENMFAFFSEMANCGQLIYYSAVRVNMNSRLYQTISWELFDDASGWQWDVYGLLLELNKL